MSFCSRGRLLVRSESCDGFARCTVALVRQQGRELEARRAVDECGVERQRFLRAHEANGTTTDAIDHVVAEELQESERVRRHADVFADLSLRQLLDVRLQRRGSLSRRGSLLRRPRRTCVVFTRSCLFLKGHTALVEKERFATRTGRRSVARV